MSVFISWSGADRDVKNVIASKLQQENITYWDSDEHCVSDFSKECIDNIRRSQVFVVIVSEASMDTKSYVINELIEARRMENDGRLNIIVYKVTDEPYTERFAMQLNHVSDSNCVARIQKLGKSGGLDALIKRVKHLLKCRADGMPEKPYDVLVPRVYGATAASSGYFVDGSRDDIINRVNDAFSSSNVIFVSGVFGFGKRTVIRRYVSLNSYTSAVEVQGIHDNLYNFFLNDLHFSNINEGAFEKQDERSVIRAKFDFLSRLDKRHILIASDVDVEDEADEFILGLLRGLNCHVVFITQNSADAYADHFPVIQVGRMQNKHLSELFFHYYDRDEHADREAVIPFLESFFEDVGGHTKTVEITASVLSKEIRADSREIKQYLSVGTDSKKTLNDRVLKKLSDLIALEDFSDEARRTLLLIALMAHPVADEDKLYGLMEKCGIIYRGVITELTAHRWITYNSHSRTVYIEPIIAQLCIPKLLGEDYSVPKVLFDSMCDSMMTAGANDAVTGLRFYTRFEHFARLLQLDEAADIFRLLRTELVTDRHDMEKCKNADERFKTWYSSFRAGVGENPSPRDEFTTNVAVWIKCYVLPLLRMSASLPFIYSLNTSRDFSDFDWNKLMDNTFDDIADDPEAMKLFDSMEEFDIDDFEDEEDDGKSLFDFLYSDIVTGFLTRDIDAVGRHFDALVDHLSKHSEYLESEEFAAPMLTVAKLIYQSCCNMGAYHICRTVLEKLMTLEWKSYYMHQILLLYVKIIVNSNDSDADAGSVIMAADELLDEAIQDNSLSREAGENVKKEHLGIYSYVLAANGQLDESIEKFSEFVSCGMGEFNSLAMDDAEMIVNRLLIEGRNEDVIVFMEKYRDLITFCAENEEFPSDVRDKAEAVLSIGDICIERGQTNISAGGVIANKSYYQHYSAEKKNDFITMMKYNRIANDAAKFDFSGFSEADFALRTQKLRERAQKGENKLKLAPEAFALVSEAGMRTLGYKHHYVQYVGAAAMLDGKIAEILNGEGKTYTIALAAYVNSLYSDKVYVLDESKYLNKRNYKWMRGLYCLLGLKTELLVKLNSKYYDGKNGGENIIYSDLETFGVNFLFKQKASADKRMDLSRCSAVIDEADYFLIESAALPIMLKNASSVTDGYLKKCRTAFNIADKIKDDPSCVTVRSDIVEFNEEKICGLIEAYCGISRDDITKTEDFMRMETLIRRAVYCSRYVQGEDFFVRDGVIYSENESNGSVRAMSGEWGYFTARFNSLPSRRYEMELYEHNSLNDIVYLYGLLKRFGTLCGTSATASSFKKEFKSIYGLDVVAVPPVHPIQRIDRTVTLYTSKQLKDTAVADMVEEKNANGQPVLLIVKNLRESAHFSQLLKERGIPHNVLNAVNSEQSPELLANAGMLGSVLIATQIANRGVDIKLGGDAERATLFELVEQGVDISSIDEILYTLPDEETRSTELYGIYTAALAKNRALAAIEREKVIAAGGLCVIGSEPYEDMRIEQQIRGRAGRQGDIGESYIFESMDDELFDRIWGTRKEGIFRMYVDNLDIIDSGFLRRSIEKFKQRMHHARFDGMKRAADISGRIEQSRAEFARLTDGLIKGTVSFKDPLKRWCNNEENHKCVAEIIYDEECDALNAVADLYEAYPDIFEPDSYKSFDKYLFAAAGECFDAVETADVIKLSVMLGNEWEKHITTMYEFENAYHKNTLKNADEFFDEAYEKDIDKRIVSAVDTWLRILLKKKQSSSESDEE
ncbi:MAG: TIR domain-containing protein [Ruminococcaceae bacterium]|nr:TIR domain-containing protein [Oscillospiraceae bacterium]